MERPSRAELSTFILELLEEAEDGLTWKELQLELRDKYDMRAHHGSVSGCLSHLHKELAIFYVLTKRDNCRPYVHSKFRNHYEESMRKDYPTTQNKWKGVADLLYFAMTADSIPADAWENALENYRKMNNG